MGNLKPIGSEKLQGIDKIRRMIEISTYNLNIPKSINEDSSDEYRKTLADGMTYHIIKEKNGYVLKRGINESTAEYIEPIKGRKFYPSYSQALKRLNLITKEINLNEGQTRNISLFNESEDIVEYVLDLEEQETPGIPPPPPPPPAGGTTPPPAPTQQGGTPPPPAEGDEMPEMDDEMPMPEPEEPMDDEEESDEEGVTFKTIQKTTGKLAQKIRAFLGDEENEMSSEDTKYVINSILSALDLSTLDDEDMEEIMTKFEGGKEGDMEKSMGTEDDEDEIDPMNDMGTPPPPPPPPAPSGEMTEYSIHGARKNRHLQNVKDVFEEVFSESKVDKVLSRYFNNSKNTNNQKNKTIDKIKNLSESFKQETKSINILNENNNSKLLGKNQYGYLVFDTGYEKIRISPNGDVV